MLELVKGCYKRTGLTETVLLSVFLFVQTVLYSTVSIRNLQGLNKGLVYPEFLVDSVCIKGTVSLDNQPRCPRITIGSCGEVVGNYLIFAGIL